MPLKTYASVTRPRSAENPTTEITVVTCEVGTPMDYLGKSQVYPFEVIFGPALEAAKAHAPGETFKIDVAMLPTRLASYASAREAIDDGKDLS
jgi:hypothetical protein